MQFFTANKFCDLKNKLTENKILSRLPLLIVVSLALLAASIYVFASTNTFYVTDQNKVQKITTISDDADKALELLGLDDDCVVLDRQKDGKVTKLTVAKTFPVIIIMGNQKMEVHTVAASVSQILALAGYTIDEYDTVEPSADTVITEKTTINYTNIDYITESRTEEIPCGTKTVYSNSVKVGTTTVQSGFNGIKQITYASKLVNGVECEKNVISDKVITLAVDSVQIVGTGSVSNAAYNPESYQNGRLTKDGGVFKNPYTGYKETWYSQKVLPGGGLTIPGRHVNSEGFICDGDGYICIASSELPRGTVVPISRGVGKVYDSGCAKGIIDVYVNW